MATPDMTGKVGDMSPQMKAYLGIDTLGAGGVLGSGNVDASPWTGMGGAQQSADQSSLMGGVGDIQTSALNQSKLNMAMRGGLGGGAAGRMDRASLDATALANQGLRAQGESGALGAGMGAANMQSEADKTNAGASQAASSFNTQNRLNSLQGNNAANMADYATKIKGFGAGQSANALAASGGKK
jgi:hypothetical protein